MPAPADKAGADGLVPAEDAHVAGVLHARAVFREKPLHPVPEWAAVVARTPLAGFRLVGFSPEQAPTRVARYFERNDGTAVIVEEWDFAADRGAVPASPGQPKVAIGKHFGTVGGVRGPSGCVSTMLSWSDGRRLRTVELVGPQDAKGQRELVEAIARGIAAAR